MIKIMLIDMLNLNTIVCDLDLEKYKLKSNDEVLQSELEVLIDIEEALKKLYESRK